MLSLACPPYDRVLPLACGMVEVQGIALQFFPMEAEEIFARQVPFGEFDVAESSLSSYVSQRAKEDTSFIAIPVFTSRFFRHSCVFIHTRKGIHSPGDLRGKKVGVPRYSMTAAVWLRGLFQHEYGVSPQDLEWWCGGQEEPQPPPKHPSPLPPDIRLASIPADKTLSGMLEEGNLDALFTAHTPSCVRRGSPRVAPLFPNGAEVEEWYFRTTGLFPIMHVITIKRELYEDHRWVARNLHQAFCQAKDMVLEKYWETGELYVTLPWLNSEAKRTREIMGDDWWPYGVVKNRRTLETFLQYHWEQGLSSRKVEVNELFASETLEE